MGTYKVQYKTTSASSWTDAPTTVTDSDHTKSKSYTITGLTNGTTYDFRVIRTDKTPNWIVTSGQATPNAAFDNSLTSLEGVEQSVASNGESAQIATVSSTRGVLVALSNNGLDVEVTWTYQTTPGDTSTNTTGTLGTKTGNTFSTGAGKVSGTNKSFLFPFPQPLTVRILNISVRVINNNGSTKATMTFSVA